MLLGDDADTATKKATSQFCESLGDLVELRGIRQPGIRLVRPDGYIAHEGALSSRVAVLESMRLLLERQTNQHPMHYSHQESVISTP